MPIVKPGTQCDVSKPINDWCQEDWQFRGPVAVVTIQKHNHVRAICRGQTREARPSIAPARFLNNPSTHSRSDLGRPIIRIAVDNDDLRRQIGRKIG